MYFNANLTDGARVGGELIQPCSKHTMFWNIIFSEVQWWGYFIPIFFDKVTEAKFLQLSLRMTASREQKTLTSRRYYVTKDNG